MSAYKYNKKKAILFSGGHIDIAFASSILNEATYDVFIAIDRGLEGMEKMGVLPDYIVGDFDSIEDYSLIDKYKGRNIPIKSYPAKKDYTDTQLGCEIAVELGCDDITILGGTGSRLDHVLCNLNLCAQLYDKGVRASIVDATNRAYVIGKGEHEIIKDSAFGSYISFMPFDDVYGFCLSGFEYDVNDLSLKRDSTLTVSNRILKNPAKIKILSGRMLVLMTKD